MTDRKLTEAELITYLQLGAELGNTARLAPEEAKTLLDLIKRQKVEIESLKIANEKMYDACKKQEAEIERLTAERYNEHRCYLHICEDLKQAANRNITAKSEVVKEFAERLKKRLERKYTIFGREYVLRHLRELVKEMTEERTE